MADENIVDTEIYAGKDCLVFSDFSETIDLVAAGPSNKSARQLFVLEAGDGNLTIQTKHGVRTLPGAILAAKSIPLNLGIFKIYATTNVGSVLVIW